ncbi:hypothetical protein O6H91_01G081200 [Diphasiastrum complanatum]|uniref:Uncharacterized protein n=1 Tax=Diphasiastrum complanatum TaxID=34168 RepID=A0ACC2ET12_DIPCM|nr:hypothetical protein O6H91_01G081200 [Diphasiastrum complanatum]
MPVSEATSASGEVSGSSENYGVQQHEHSSGTSAPSGNDAGGQAPAKKKRNLPGTPDPEAEVISLSPSSLMATNRFVCEICGKGFQRDQNLQLHRRGHNLPWKLRQRTSEEPRKRVYICPELSCVHHDPSRALGDLTGIKKHFCRKHGEKKWKCDKCNKRYAVQSDWKAHSKTCGTREYRCDCGTLFSRRDSFITHRAFCEALAEETARISAGKQGPQLFYVPNDSLGVYATESPLSMRGSTSSQAPYAVRNVASSLHPEVAGASLAKEIPMPPLRWAQSTDQGSGAPTAGPRLSLWSDTASEYSLLADRHLADNSMSVSQLSASSPVVQTPISLQRKAGIVEIYGNLDEGQRNDQILSLPGGIFSNLLTSRSSFCGLQGSVAGVFDFKDSPSHTASAELSLSIPGITGESSARYCSSVSSFLSQQIHTLSNLEMSATALLQKVAKMGATTSSCLSMGCGMAGAHSSSFGLGASFRQGPEQEQGKSPCLGNLSASSWNGNLSESRAGNASTELGVSTSSLGAFSIAAQSRSSQQIGNHDFIASFSRHEDGFFEGLSTLPPNVGSYVDGVGAMQSRNSHPVHMSAGEVLNESSFQGAPESSDTPPMLPGLGGVFLKVEEGADRFTRDFLGVCGTAGPPVTAEGMGKTPSQTDLASITSLGIGLDVNTNHRKA